MAPFPGMERSGRDSADHRSGQGEPTDRPGPRGSRRFAPRPGPRRTPVVRFGIVAVIAAGLVWLVYAVFVLTEAGQRAENLALEGAALQTAGDRADSLGQLSQISLASLGLAMLFVVLVAWTRRRAILGIGVVAAMATAIALSEILKAMLARPALVEGPAWLLRNSFPSGSATVAACVGVAILFVSPGRIRWLALPVAGILAAIIGQATQIAGWHRMSDALGAVLLAIAVNAAMLAVLAAAGYVTESGGGRISRRVRWSVGLAGLATIVLGGAILLIAVVFPVLRAPSGASGAFLHTSLDLVGAGATIVAFVVIARLVEPFSLGERLADSARLGGPEAGEPSAVG